MCCSSALKRLRAGVVMAMPIRDEIAQAGIRDTINSDLHLIFL
jgi:hypothetical protein